MSTDLPNSSQNQHYDVGIIGVWRGCNYGSIATYYALHEIIHSFGKTVLMIDKPIISKNDVELTETHSYRFGKEYYNISEPFSLDEAKRLNEICDTFVIGSDQVWNYGISKNFKKFFYLDFVEETKRKIAYGVSFGHSIDFAPPEERGPLAELMSRFEGISVREDDGVKICAEEYGVKAVQVLDPVFVVDTSVFERLADKSKKKDLTEPFLATYILDPTPEKREAILFVAQKLGNIKIINMLDGLPWLFKSNKEKMDLPNCVEDLQIEDWLYYIKNSEFVITDSCHGASLSLLFNKQFIPIINKRRGFSRFKSLAKVFSFEDRLVVDANEISQKPILFEPLPYDSINAKLIEERAQSLSWLKDKLFSEKKDVATLKKQNIIGTPNTEEKPEVVKLLNDPDFIKIRMLATLLRDYGVKHIVLSPGGRDVPLVRIFEYNDNIFTLHRVTDERSAAYYGMGIAAQLRRPVACVCTSGTAVSNYLPAVTESYYTGIPLIMITADRYEIYHEQGEDQTIPQDNIFKGVIKKEITIPELVGTRAENQARRDISECILESTHHNPGPVHINIAIGDIAMGANVPRTHWALLPKIHPHILRVNLNDDHLQIMRWVEHLRKSKRILVVYGQNAPATEKQIKYIEKFTNKYNCVIVNDYISNLNCKYGIKPHNMLQRLSQIDFNEMLSPDILISVGGKRLMNDPLTFKIRGGLKNIRHWSVRPDGKVKDFYFRLTSVLEMSQDKFFELFSENAGDIKNNEEYYKAWEALSTAYPSPVIEDFNSNYIQSKFLPLIPKNSMLHLGVGQSFYDCRKYHIDSSVEVFCNMGTNGIDGCTSTFLGQCSVIDDRLCFLLVGDLSFFYDMNSIWNKPLKGNIRILLVNNNVTGLLRGHRLKGISSVHNTAAKGWVESTGFKYISASSKEEFEKELSAFLSNESKEALFFEVFCN